MKDNLLMWKNLLGKGGKILMTDWKVLSENERFCNLLQYDAGSLLIVCFICDVFPGNYWGITTY